jgi:dihydroorotate dehydrogenase (fumarate)
MADLSTTLMGLRLRNPVVVSSSQLTSSLEGVRECADAGAGAVVLKSLFEEQIMADTDRAIEEATFLTHTEAEDYFVAMGRNHYMDLYFSLVESAKKAVSIPVIASVNCITAETWVEYARGFESAGADALELNVFILPLDATQDSRRLEAHYLDVASRLAARVKIPVAMKIGFHFTALAQVIQALSRAGVKALVLFNRFHRLDFDIEGLRLVSAPSFSAPEEIALSLQWISLMSGRVSCDLVANTGVHDGAGVVKQLLAGARAVELCTAIQKKGARHIRKILDELEAWMKRRSFGSVRDFSGLLSRERSKEPRSYERSQYLKGIGAST